MCDKKMTKKNFELIVEIYDDLSLERIESYFVRFKKNNIKWLLIPPQHNHIKKSKNEWSDRYVPTSYSISENKDFLTKLVQTAKNYDINIIVDVVFNHCDPQVYQKLQQIDPNLFHDPKSTNITKRWFYGALPSWNTERADIKKNALDVINELRSIGVKGFRFDAAPYIEHEFYDYLLTNSPQEELHIFEVKHFDAFDIKTAEYTEFRNFYEYRIKFRPTSNTIFYDFYAFNNIYNLIKNNGYSNQEKSIYSQTIMPGYGLEVGTTHDEISHNFKDLNQETIYAAQLMNFWASPNNYGVTTMCCDSPISNCLLWNFDTLEKFIVPLIRAKNQLGELGFKPVNLKTFLIDKNLIISLNRPSQASFVMNVTNCEETIYDKLNSQLLDKLNLADLGFENRNLESLWNKNFLKNSINGYIHVQQRAFELLSTKGLEQNNSKYFIHMVWYQGADNLPADILNSVKYWQNFIDLQNQQGQNLALKIWSAADVLQLDLDEDELYILNKLQENFPKPDLYGAFSDIARLIILKRESGMYVDTDTNPRFDTHKIMAWAQSGTAVLFGNEPSCLINNAVIGCPLTAQSRQTIEKILKEIIKEYRLTGSLDVIDATGPGILTKILDKMDKNEYLCIPVDWMFLTWSDRVEGKKNFCTNHLTLLDHCYHASWVSKFSKFNCLRLNSSLFSYGYQKLEASLEVVILILGLLLIFRHVKRPKI
jgi:hypothetical protein